tara:strand:+ start:835 stop:2604 length:1770 start_codon:yes stop_codon:yes gene_type:complete
MGAYDNPKIIRDTSGQIYGQALANFGKQVGAGLTTAFKKEEQEKIKADKEIERQQRIAYNVENKMYNNANKNYSLLATKDPSLVGMFKSKVEKLLRGDRDNMGAIKAQTLLDTKNDLTPDERQQYRGIIQKAQAFQISSVQGGGQIIADLEDVNGVLGSDIASTHAWVGNPGLESDTSMLTSYVLGNKKVDGLVGEKDLIAGEDGSMIVKSISKVDKDSQLFKDLDSETQEFLKNNDYKIEWQRNINEWKEGLIAEIPEDIDYNQVAENSGFMDEKGSIKPKYIIGNEDATQSVILPSGKTADVRYVDVDGFIDGKSFKDDIGGKATRYQGRPNGQLSSFMRYKMRKGSFNSNDFREKTTPDQLNEIQDALTESFKQTKLSGLIQRPANKSDVANLKALGKTIKVGQPLYIEQVGESRDTPSNTYEASLGVNVINEVLKIKIKNTGEDSGFLDEKLTKSQAESDNVEAHKNYLRKKGINAKSKADLIKQLEKAKGSEDGDGVKIDDDYIQRFKDSAQNLYVYDAENKKQYELPSYDPNSNESLLPILNEYGGFGSKTKEQISTITSNPREKNTGRSATDLINEYRTNGG